MLTQNDAEMLMSGNHEIAIIFEITDLKKVWLGRVGDPLARGDGGRALLVTLCQPG